MNKNLRIFIDVQIILVLLAVGVIGSPFMNEPLINAGFSGACGGIGIMYLVWRITSYLFKD